ncbi:MAG: alpha/beta fold hydrolase [Caulobacteraceae bacterium]
MPRSDKPATFVLVHGSWHGGWCWRRVADRLTARGHKVYTPTLSGLAERSHANNPRIDLSTHVDDVAGLLKWEALEDVVLVGHSYAGMVISGVAEKAAPGAIGSIVFLDAFLPEDRKCLFDYVTGGEGGPGAAMAAEGKATGFVSPIPAAVFNVNEADRDWVDSQCTPQSYRCFLQRLRLTGARERIPKKAFILATEYMGLRDASFVDKVKADPTWRYYEVACGHDVMLDEPDRLTEILEEVA